MAADANPAPSTRQFAVFEVTFTTLDKPTERRRWNGGPMHSEEATGALYAAVDAFRAALREHGFEGGICQYGGQCEGVR